MYSPGMDKNAQRYLKRFQNINSFQLKFLWCVFPNKVVHTILYYYNLWGLSHIPQMISPQASAIKCASVKANTR